MFGLSIHRIWAVILRQWYESIHSMDRIVDSFFWPALDIIVWGFTMFFISEEVSLNIVNVLLGALIFWTFTYSVQRDITLASMQDLWDQNLYNIFASPLRPLELLIGGTLLALARLIVLFFLMYVLAAWLYGFSFFALLPMMLGGVTTVIVFGVFSGVLTTALIYRFGTRVQIITWSALAALMPFVGVTYPVSVLPESAQIVSWLLPPTYVFAYVRSFIATGSVPTLADWVAPTALNVVYCVGALVLFYAAYRHAKGRGWFVKMD